MASYYLSEDLLSSITCPPDQSHQEIYDSLMKGFYVDIQRSGRMTFRVRYKLFNKTKICTLGDARVLTLEEAREAARDVLRLAMKDINPKELNRVSSGMSVEDFFENRYLPFVKSYKRSWKTDESIIRNHVLDLLGHLSMDSVTPGDIVNCLNLMHDKKYAPATCNRFLILIKYGFKLAISWEIKGVTRNPAKDIKELSQENKIERCLTQAQAEDLLKSARQIQNGLVIYIIQFLIQTGARKREALDAEWHDIDFEQRLWRIPKSKSGKVRHIPLSSEALSLLVSLKANAPAGTSYIFANPDTGKPFVSIFQSWDLIRRRAGLPSVRMHDLRHSFASFLVNAGRSLYEVQQLLGHADIRTTSRYSHLSRKTLREAVENIPTKLDWDS